MEHLFLLATITMITVKISFTYFHSSSCWGNICWGIKIMQSISPNYNGENGVKQIKLLKKFCHKVASCVSCLEQRRWHQGQNASNIFFIFTTIFLISAK